MGTRLALEDVRWTRIFFAVLLIAQAGDIARYAPDYLSYFTVLVKPANTWQLLSDSNTDWGQGMFALRQYQTEHPNQKLSIWPMSGKSIRYFMASMTNFKQDHPSGTVIVSATDLSGQLLQNHYAYRWLLQYPVKTILNHTLYVFFFFFEVPRAERKCLTTSQLFHLADLRCLVPVRTIQRHFCRTAGKIVHDTP